MWQWCENDVKMMWWCDRNCNNDAFSYDSTREEEEDCLSIGSRWSASYLPNKAYTNIILIIFWIVDFDFVTSRHSFGAEDRAGLTITTIWLSQLSNYLTITTIWLSDNHNNLTHHVRFTDWLKNSNLTQHYRNTWLTHGILAAWYFVIYLNVDFSHLMQ